jgi:hypothetical protein
VGKMEKKNFTLPLGNSKSTENEIHLIFLIVVVPISKNPVKFFFQFSQCVAHRDTTQVSRYPAPGSTLLFSSAIFRIVLPPFIFIFFYYYILRMCFKKLVFNIFYSGSSGFLCDSTGKRWAIDSNGIITVDGVEDSSTANVIELAYVSGVIWQEVVFFRLIITV